MVPCRLAIVALRAANVAATCLTYEFALSIVAFALRAAAWLLNGGVCCFTVLRVVLILLSRSPIELCSEVAVARAEPLAFVTMALRVARAFCACVCAPVKDCTAAFCPVVSDLLRISSGEPAATAGAVAAVLLLDCGATRDPVLFAMVDCNAAIALSASAVVPAIVVAAAIALTAFPHIVSASLMVEYDCVPVGNAFNAAFR